MSVVSLTTLKSYFETGDKPTQPEFENLIDTLGQFIGVLVPFKLSLTNAQLKAGGEFDIAELPEPGAGYAWGYVEVSGKTENTGTPFDGSPQIFVGVDTGREQFTDGGVFLSTGTPYFQRFKPEDITSALTTSYKENKKGIVTIDNSSSVGDGEITIYGLARKITLE